MSKTKTVTFPEDQFNTLCNLFQLMAVAGLKFHATGDAIPSDVKINDIWKTLVKSALSRNQPENTELEFLRFYFKRVYSCLGPADSDIVDSIKTEFTKITGKPVPEDY